MKVLKLNLFQEAACYKKPFAFKVSETYPLPPYSTVIGMFHKILQAKSGEYFPMNLSIQGEFDSIYSNYQTLRMFKGKDQVTQMPRNVHELLNIHLIIHVQAEDSIIDKIYQNIIQGETFSLGRNEDMVRLDAIKEVSIKNVSQKYLEHNAYIPLKICKENDLQGVSYRLNTTYEIDKNNLRDWTKVEVQYVEKGKNQIIEDGWIDEEEDLLFFYKPI